MDNTSAGIQPFFPFKSPTPSILTDWTQMNTTVLSILKSLQANGCVTVKLIFTKLYKRENFKKKRTKETLYFFTFLVTSPMLGLHLNIQNKSSFRFLASSSPSHGCSLVTGLSLQENISSSQFLISVGEKVFAFP